MRTKSMEKWRVGEKKQWRSEGMGRESKGLRSAEMGKRRKEKGWRSEGMINRKDGEVKNEGIQRERIEK